MLPVMSEQGNTHSVTAVVAGDAGLGAALVERLGRRDHGSVALVPAADEPTEAVAALESLAGVRTVVHVCGDDTALVGAPLTATDSAAWEARCERVLWRTLCTLQAAHWALSEGGGRVVVVTATAGVSGAPSAVPLVAAVEGARAMAKSAARQWGGVGISVNCVAVPLDMLAPNLAGLTSFLPPAALAPEDPIDDLAAAVEFWGGPDARGISGATLLVDRGAVMAP
jgi:3-oxoacyl-[acyl-carrier protein] reductase